ncbi:hypothetical protein [Streptomyces pseudogriseolus]
MTTAGVVSALSVCGEYSSGTIATTLTALVSATLYAVGLDA